MEVALVIVLLFALFASARWVRDELRRPHCKARLFLSVQSYEEEERFLRPQKSLLLRKPLLLQTAPTPGMEIDGHGTNPTKIARAVLDANSAYQVLLYLEPIRVPVAEVETYAKELAANCGWEILW